jgi:hypothetical protein
MTRSFPAAPHLSAHALTREVAFMNRTIIQIYLSNDLSRFNRTAPRPMQLNFKYRF